MNPRMPIVAAALLCSLAAATSANALPVTFSNTGVISINDFGHATPFPSSIAVAGITNVTDVNVTLFGLSHTFPDDLEIVLQGPNGATVYLWSSAGGSAAVADIDVTFDDEAAAAIPDSGPLATGSYQVSQYIAPLNDFPFPVSFGTFLDEFDGLDANGIWNLYIIDNATGDVGSISGGWQLTFDASTSEVPEPGTLALFGLGLAGLGAALRKRAA